MSKSKHERVLEAIEGRFFEEGELSGIREISEHTGLSKSVVRSTVDDLIGTGIEKIYDREKVVTLYITQGMKNAIYARAGEPEWIASYEFDEKEDLREELEEKQKKIDEFQELERLLYSTGDPLEDSVEAAFELLGYEFGQTADEEDFWIKYDGEVYVIEVKGKAGQLQKKNVTQLNGWLDKWLDEDGVTSENLHGIALINPYRNDPPSERGEPLTEKAEEYLKMRSSEYRMTESLFKIVKSVKDGDKDVEQARKEFLRVEA